MEFKIAKLDKMATIVTASVAVLLIGLSVFFIHQVPYGWVFAAVMLFIIVFSYLLSPSNYFIEGGKLIIRKVIGQRIIIPLKDVEGIAVVPDFARLRIARTFGNGGLFGYYGFFSTSEYGTMNCQLKRLKDILVIRAADKAYAVSPADMSGFREYFENSVKGSNGNIQELVPATATAAKQASPLILIVPAAILIVTVVMILSLRSILPERIAVHFDMHGTPNGWASRMSFVISGLVPAAVLFVISAAVFYYVRRTTTRTTIPYLIVGLFSVFQFFAAYVSLDTYWVNTRGSHLIPFPCNIIIYAVIIAALVLTYYRKIKVRT
jgi:hypothetical protein